MKNFYRSTGVSLLLFLLCVAGAAAQVQLSVFDLKTAAFPTIGAKILAADNAGNIQTTLRPEDIVVTENGVRRPVTSLSCRTVQMPRPLSIAVSFDLSSSMQWLDVGLEMPHVLGQHAMRFLAQQVPLPLSEMAIQGFDAYLPGGIPLTTDRKEFLREVDQLPNLFNNDFFVGLTDKDRGTLNVVKSGAHRRIAILVSDEDAFLGPYNENIIRDYIDTCAKYNIRFYAVIFRVPAPKVFTFQALVDATGGRVYDLLKTRSEAEAAIRDILAREQGGNGCDIEWESLPGCPAVRDVKISIPSHSLSTETEYSAPVSGLPNLRFEPAGLAFGVIAPGTSQTLDVTVTAENLPATILTIDSITAPFSLDGVSLPITLRAGESRTLTVRFTPTDSTLSFAQLRFNRDDCSPVRLDLSGGVRRKGQRLQVEAPDGGEKLSVGNIAPLTWHGVETNVPLTLEYSIDRGTQWRTITQNAVGLEHLWMVPNSPSDSCLLRVSHTGMSSRAVDFLDAGRYHTWCAFSPTDTMIAVANFANTASLRSAATGLEVRRLIGHIAPLTRVEFSPDGRYVVTASVDNTVRIWDVATGETIRILSGHAGPVSSASFSPDGGRVVTTADFRSIIWSVATGEKLAEFSEGKFVRESRFNHDGSRIVTSSKDVVVRDAFSGTELHRISLTAGAHQAEFNDDGSMLLVIEGNTIAVFETSTWRMLSTFSTRDNRTFPMAHFRAGDHAVLVASLSFIELRDPYSGRLLTQISTGSTGAVNAAFSRDRRRLVSVEQGSGTIWNLAGAAIDADLSDDLWSIVMPVDLVADFTIADDSICAGECIEPVATSIANVGTWEWTFSGGTPSTASGANPGRICYAEPGRYPVQLIVANAAQRDTVVRYLTVAPAPAIPLVSQCGGTLVASVADSYQWYRDDVLIDGATSQELEIDRPGTYFVRSIGAGGCVAVSAPYVVTDEPPGVAISIADIEGAPGDIVHVPVALAFSQPGDPTPYRVTLRLDYNASLLRPIDLVPSAVAMGRRSVELTVAGEALRDTTVMVVFRVALGDSPSTTVVIDEASIDMSCPIELSADDGLLSLSGLCTNGGVRLVATAEASTLKAILPNPVRGEVRIEYSLVESGRIDIALYDLPGNRVATIASGALPPGGYATTFDLSGLPSGRYLCVYTTPTARFSEVVIVE